MTKQENKEIIKNSYVKNMQISAHFKYGNIVKSIHVRKFESLNKWRRAARDREVALLDKSALHPISCSNS
jgi:hypothetical protein